MDAAARMASPILLADDEPALREPLASALRERGFETIEAGTGSEAYRLGCEFRPRLSVLDINMPDLTGVEVFRRWLGEGVKMPVIFVTAEASEDLRVQAIELGARAVMQKPFAVKELFRLVQELTAA